MSTRKNEVVFKGLLGYTFVVMAWQSSVQDAISKI